MILDDLLRVSQTHPGAFRRRTELLEESKDLVVVGGRNSDSVVPNGTDPLTSLDPSSDLDGSDGGSTVIRNAGIEIVTTALDIGGPIDDLRSAVGNLAELISSTGEPS